MRPSRRRFLTAALAVQAFPAFLPGLAAQAAPSALPPTPACDDGDAPTLAQTEGPYFKPDTPLKRDLAADAPRGERVTVAGYVLDRRCQPMRGALVELWHAHDRG